MITLQSTPKQIRQELDEDEKRANYWFIRQHHGERGFHKWRMDQCKRLYNQPELKELFSDPVEYKSPNGNRWLAYEHTSRDGEGGIFTFTYTVCYFETYESVGAYVRMDSESYEGDKMIPGCVFYTPHFFQRFAERLGIEYRSRAMMLRFLQLAHHHLIMDKKTNRDGFKDTEIVMRYPASYAFGTRRIVDGYQMVTVRTFLPVTMMTPTKKKELEEYGAFSDEYIGFFARERMKTASKEIHLPIYK